jgi:hypothetical protein
MRCIRPQKQGLFALAKLSPAPPDGPSGSIAECPLGLPKLVDQSMEQSVRTDELSHRYHHRFKRHVILLRLVDLVSYLAMSRPPELVLKVPAIYLRSSASPRNQCDERLWGDQGETVAGETCWCARLTVAQPKMWQAGTMALSLIVHTDPQEHDRRGLDHVSTKGDLERGPGS